MEKGILRSQIRHKIINKLNETGLDYVVVGAAALIVHGLPRSTLDIDIYLPAERNILNKIFKIADSLGLKSEQKDILKISHSPELFSNQWICFSSQGQDILDIFFTDEEEFKALYENSELKQDQSLRVRVASLNDLMAMKKASGRAIDLADIKLIEEAKKYRQEGD